MSNHPNCIGVDQPKLLLLRTVFALLAGFEMPGKFHGRPSVQFSLTYIDWQKDVVQCKLKIECFLAWALLSRHSWQRKGRTLTLFSVLSFVFFYPHWYSTDWRQRATVQCVCLTVWGRDLGVRGESTRTMVGVVFACGHGFLRPARKPLTLAEALKCPTAVHTGVWFFSSWGHHVEITQWISLAGATQPLTLQSFENKQCVAFSLVSLLSCVWPVFCSSVLQVFAPSSHVPEMQKDHYHPHTPHSSRF